MLLRTLGLLVFALFALRLLFVRLEVVVEPSLDACIVVSHSPESGVKIDTLKTQ